MKTLSEIVNICKDGEKPDIDDARFAICALDALITFDSTHLMRMAQREESGKGPGLFTAERNYAEHFNRVKRAMGKTPIEWLGAANNPDDPEVQKRRTASLKLWNKIMSDPHKLSTK